MTEPPDLFDVAACWDGLPSDVQRRLGIASIIAGMAGAAEWIPDAMFAAGRAAEAGIDAIVWEHVIPAPDHVDGPIVVPRPDLAAIGIRACRACGCTDQVACEWGCGWATEDLCTTCTGSAP